MKALFVYSFLWLSFAPRPEPVFLTRTGSVSFQSDAPLELIEARSDQLKGVLDLKTREYAFSVDVASFEGFNSPLQREHFNENYLESDQFPQATYTGKIIEETDLTKPGEYAIRTKGKLTIHGIEQERIIKNFVRVEKDAIYIESTFSVLLEEHQISIPKIVHQKIAEEIKVSVQARLLRQP